MINLSDHMCYHCRNMNHYQRTIHGQYQHKLRELQKEISTCLDSRDFDRVQYLKQEEERVMASMHYFERHPHTNMKYEQENKRM